MSIKIRIPRSSSTGVGRFLPQDAVLRAGVAIFLIAAVVVTGVFTFYWVKYARIVDRRLSGPIFDNTAKIYGAPEVVRVGERISGDEIAEELQRAGYSQEGARTVSRIGVYRLEDSGIGIEPGPESYHGPGEAELRIEKGKISDILAGGQRLGSYELEPQLVTALSTQQRSKRQVVKYQDIPKVMREAVLSIEDRRFFQHGGVNYFRLAEATLVDLREGRHEQGGSTITMQVARMFFLSPQKTIHRKLVEMLISIELEQRFSKEQIFEFYANQVDLGQRGSFAIHGFAEAAHAFFNKDLQAITLPEAALLAGLIQRPSYLSPYRHPERALDRRNMVLDAMVENHAITREQAERAKAAPLKLAPMNVEASDAPYFVDLVKDTLTSHFSDQELTEGNYHVYSTLDPDLQKDAAQAVAEGLKDVDAKLLKLRTRRIRIGKGRKAKWETRVVPGPQAQVALVAMDPHTGHILALVGGRNYAFSQLDHAIAKRPTGSIFKPFVYAAAINTALTGGIPPASVAAAQANSTVATPGGDNTASATPAAASSAPAPAANTPPAAPAAVPTAPLVVTPVTLINDEPTTFSYGDQIYEPRNYKDEYHGQITARYALALSLNNATVALAQLVGYDKVADLARAAGINSVQPTPAMALGAYDATPLEMASAYTVFANGGVKLSSVLINSVRNSSGKVLASYQPEQKPVLDPRVAYVMTNMMEGVLNFGTAYGVRAAGFNAPAAGKTGTSHDAWFAGYTSDLLCIVWVGYDDYSDIRLSGAEIAAPMWTDFMKRAVKLPEYRDVSDFEQPTGVVNVQLDKVTNALATSTCPNDYVAAFIAGTEPTETCDQALGEHRGFLARILGLGAKPTAPPPVVGQPNTAQTGQQAAGSQNQAATDPKKKKGLFGKIVGIFKEDDKPSAPSPPPAQPH
ncbi:MAG TPA: transglycosylase domain-containing protein [Terriglobales bacterium]|nr:transglycosylase domain-containing protein [Terriglobales bacterium]